MISSSTSNLNIIFIQRGFQQKLPPCLTMLDPGIYPWDLPVFPGMTNKAQVFFVLLLCVPSQQLWSWRDGQFT